MISELHFCPRLEVGLTWEPGDVRGGGSLGMGREVQGPCRAVTHLSWPGSTHTNFRSKVWTLWPWKKMETGAIQSCIYRVTCTEVPQIPGPEHRPSRGLLPFRSDTCTEAPQIPGPELRPPTAACSPLEAAAPPSFLTLGPGQASLTPWGLPGLSRNTVGPWQPLLQTSKAPLAWGWRPTAEPDTCRFMHMPSQSPCSGHLLLSRHTLLSLPQASFSFYQRSSPALSLMGSPFECYHLPCGPCRLLT